MIIYRPHRGGIGESMAEAQEFETELEMKKFIVEYWNNNRSGNQILFSLEDLVIANESINDERIGWEDSRYVSTKRMGDIDYMKQYGVPQCIGMCASIYKPLMPPWTEHHHK